MQPSVEGEALCSSGEQQSARRSPDRRESTTGILRHDFSKPRRSSGSSVEFRSPPGRTGSNGVNIMARYCTFLSVRFRLLTNGRYEHSNYVRGVQNVHIVRPRVAHTELFDGFRLSVVVQAHRSGANVIPVHVRQLRRYHKITQQRIVIVINDLRNGLSQRQNSTGCSAKCGAHNAKCFIDRTRDLSVTCGSSL